MDSWAVLVLLAILIFAVSAAGAWLPRVGSLSDRRLHLMLALSAGIFIGLLFLVLFPEALDECGDAGIESRWAMVAALCGFLLILGITVWLRRRHTAVCACGGEDDLHGHRLNSYVSFAGLGVHSAFDGLALAATFLGGEGMAAVAAAGICIHKFVELFSLSSMTMVSDIPKRRSARYLGGFCLITPLASLILYAALGEVSDIEGVAGIPLAFACGTLMYVALCNLLPEAFHRKGRQEVSLGVVVLGILVIAALVVAFPDSLRGAGPPQIPYRDDPIAPRCRNRTCGLSSS